MRQGIRLPFLTAVLCLRVEFPQILLFGLKIRTVWAGVPSDPETGDEEIRIPVIEEEIVIETRPVVMEELRLRKEVVEEEEVVEQDVRKEEVDIDDQTERRNR